MSRADTESLLRRCFDAFNASDHAAILASVSEEVALDIGYGPRETGRDKLRRLLAERAGHFEDRAGDLAIMTDESGVRAAAEFTLRGRYVATAPGFAPASGQSYSVPASILVEVDDGLITRASLHVDMDGLAARLAKG